MKHILKYFLWTALLAVFFSTVTPSALAAGGNAAAAGENVFNMSIAYGITSAEALLLAAGYGGLVRRKNPWLLLLFISVVIVNLGYFSLSISKTLDEALLANRIAYLGSVFLPLCMLMAIADVCRIRYWKWLPVALLCISLTVFLLAASPGYLDCYYSDVSLVFIKGMAKLEKVYGPLHFVYLLYLLVFLGLMVSVIVVSIAQKTVVSHKHASLLLIVVFLNITIWLVEQLVYTEFEFLSVSYIISELLLLMLYGMMQDYGILPDGQTPFAGQPGESAPAQEVTLPPDEPETPAEEETFQAALSPEQIRLLSVQWSAQYLLTAREAEVLSALLQDKKRKDIAADMNVTEHTIKKHTGNIFSKLEVSSRAELFDKAKNEP